MDSACDINGQSKTLENQVFSVTSSNASAAIVRQKTYCWNDEKEASTPEYLIFSD